jgi:bacterioferritin
LGELLKEEAQDELGHATYLTDVISDLAGQPTTTPKPFDKPADLKGMLELNVKMETEDVADYMAHAELAGKPVPPELELKLEEMVADKAGHGRELRRLRQHDVLVGADRLDLLRAERALRFSPL